MRVFFICMVEKVVPNVEEALPGPIEAANAGVYVLGTMCFFGSDNGFCYKKAHDTKHINTSDNGFFATKKKFI